MEATTAMAALSFIEASLDQLHHPWKTGSRNLTWRNITKIHTIFINIHVYVYYISIYLWHILCIYIYHFIINMLVRPILNFIEFRCPADRPSWAAASPYLSYFAFFSESLRTFTKASRGGKIWEGNCRNLLYQVFDYKYPLTSWKQPPRLVLWPAGPHRHD